uniref:NADH dehydrogenase subunit 6 n=1 Tax=Zyginella minuta TaxID=2769890 RepID=A0A7H0DHZ7_9HEMI|nr:NADH dehydrogenase subunit 6 [Zyginella minuta]QNP08957.1 NADH dehydrogenase subunit 6 [Zyginella minuta]
MKLMIIKIMIVLSSTISFLKNPMSMGLMLLMQTMMMIMLINKLMTTSWFTMMTFLMLIGGLLILFTYMSSIACNEKFKIKINLVLILLIMVMITDEMIIDSQINEKLNLIFTNNMDMSLSKIYNSKSMMITMLLVLYLLLTMVSVTKIVKHYKGPLRAFN